eukprot:422064-Karenia_brevis.AAC.1
MAYAHTWWGCYKESSGRWWPGISKTYTTPPHDTEIQHRAQARRATGDKWGRLGTSGGVSTLIE